MDMVLPGVREANSTHSHSGGAPMLQTIRSTLQFARMLIRPTNAPQSLRGPREAGESTLPLRLRRRGSTSPPERTKLLWKPQHMLHDAGGDVRPSRHFAPRCARLDRATPEDPPVQV